MAIRIVRLGTPRTPLGCYCAEEAHCHRSILRALLLERGAEVR